VRGLNSSGKRVTQAIRLLETKRNPKLAHHPAQNHPIAWTYEVRAAYLSNQRRIKDVAVLPEVHGVMVIGLIYAKPVLVRIQ
jgi:hypothetical protein